MAFFNQMAPGGMGGAGGSPSAFTSPGINPMTLAMLLRMQGMGGAQGAPGAAGMMGGPAGGAPMAGPPGGGGVPQGGAPQMPSPVTMNAGMRPGGPMGGAGMPPGASASPTGANPMLAQLLANPAMAQHLMQMLGMGGAAATGAPTSLLPGMGAGAAPAGGTGGLY